MKYAIGASYAPLGVGAALVAACLIVASSFRTSAEPAPTGERPVGSNAAVDDYEGPALKGVFDSCLPSCDLYLVESGQQDGMNLTETDSETQEGAPDISPDETSIAYRCGLSSSEPEAPGTQSPPSHTAICMVPAAGGQTRALLKATDASFDEPAWSPDGGRLAYVKVTSIGTEIGVAASGGSDADTLVQEPGVLFGPTWSPTGEAIAFVCGGSSDQAQPRTQFCTIPSGGGETSTLGSIDGICGSPAFAPDGLVLAVVCWQPDSDAGDLFTLSVGEGMVIPLTTDRGIPLEGNARPRWSADGEYLFVRRSDALLGWSFLSRGWSQPAMPPLHGEFDVMSDT